MHHAPRGDRRLRSPRRARRTHRRRSRRGRLAPRSRRRRRDGQACRCPHRPGHAHVLVIDPPRVGRPSRARPEGVRDTCSPCSAPPSSCSGDARSRRGAFDHLSVVGNEPGVRFLRSGGNSVPAYRAPAVVFLASSPPSRPRRRHSPRRPPRPTRRARGGIERQDPEDASPDASPLESGPSADLRSAAAARGGER